MKNPEAGKVEVHFFSDAAKTEKDEAAVAAVRDYLKSLSGFGYIHIHEAEENQGLSSSIISGVGRLLESAPGIIVLEDDMACQPFFLQYMIEGLERYANDVQVASIHAYTYPIEDLPESFFLKGADCWGWATWPRAWRCFEENGALLLDKLIRQKALRRFNYEGSYPYQRMLEQQIKGENQSWAVRWYASALLQGMLTLYPGKSLIRNLGNDNSGTHSQLTDIYEPLLAESKPNFPLQIEESEAAYKAFVRFFKKSRRKAILEKLGFKWLF